MTDKKYELTDEIEIARNGVTKLHRIRALCDIPKHNVKAGDLGGFIESEHNLSHFDCAWVADTAAVYDRAVVEDDALVKGRASVFEKAVVYGQAVISERADIYGHAEVFEQAKVSGTVTVHDHAWVRGGSVITGAATIRDNAIITSSEVSNCAIISGYARVYDSVIFDEVRVCGDCVVKQSNVGGSTKLQFGRFEYKDWETDLRDVIRCSTTLVPDPDGWYTMYKYVHKMWDGQYMSCYDPRFKYYDGKVSYADNPDPDIKASCAAGLHVSNATYWEGTEVNAVLIACKVHIDDIITCADGKCRCKKLTVIGEVKL